jgi:hypothetical protein
MNPRKLFNKYYLDIQKGKNLGRYIYVEWPLRMMITKKFIQHVVFLGEFDPKEAQLALKYMTCSHHVNKFIATLPAFLYILFFHRELSLYGKFGKCCKFEI